MNTVRDIVKQIGTARFAAAIGVNPSAVSNMKAAGVFPAKKYHLVLDICRDCEVDAPDESLFSFDKRTDAKTSDEVVK